MSTALAPFDAPGSPCAQKALHLHSSQFDSGQRFSCRYQRHAARDLVRNIRAHLAGMRNGNDGRLSLAIAHHQPSLSQLEERRDQHPELMAADILVWVPGRKPPPLPRTGPDIRGQIAW